MTLLAVAALLWVGVHVGLAGSPLRGRLVARLGEGGFRGVFSLLSVGAIALLIGSYKAADYVPLWVAPAWVGWLLVLAMLVASVLFVGSMVGPNPTLAGGEAALDAAPRALVRITRHPMLWAFAIWAAVHVIGNGDAASLLFFGAFLVTSLAGMPSIDAKIARRDPVRWARLAAVSSIIPGAAVLGHRTRVTAAELGWIVPLGGLVLWALLIGAHPHVIGVSPLPAHG